MVRYLANATVFDAPVQTIVNTVNCEGVMGKGLALEVKRRYPQVFEKYRQACERGELRIGKLQLVKTYDVWVLNFPTKVRWREGSQLAYLEAGLTKFRQVYRRKGITSVAFPPLGCGNGGLEWQDVRPVMEKHLSGLKGIKVYVCLGKPISKRPKQRRRTGILGGFRGGSKKQAQLSLAFA